MTLLDQERHGRSYAAALSGNLPDWLPDGERMMRAARERPEALLVIAAGLALLLRGGGRMRGNRRSRMEMRGRRLRQNIAGDTTSGWTPGASAAAQAGESVAESVREGAESMTRYASDMAGRMTDAASEYTDAATRWAGDAGETLAAQARSLSGELDEAVRDHPLVLAALGVAVGAALGASLPASDFENRTFGSARDQLGDAAQGMSGRFTEAAEDALEAAKRGAERRGLSGEAMRDMAREAAGAFASTAAGSETREAGRGQEQGRDQQRDQRDQRDLGQGRSPQGSGGQGSGGQGSGGQGSGGGRRN